MPLSYAEDELGRLRFRQQYSGHTKSSVSSNFTKIMWLKTSFSSWPW